MRARATGALLALTLAGAVASGCGSSDSSSKSEPKPAQYRVEVGDICEEHEADLAKVDSDRDAAQLIAAVRAIDRDLDAELADVEPPSSLEAEHEELVDALDELHAVSIPDWLEDGYDEGDDPDEVEAYGRDYEAALTRVQQASKDVDVPSCVPEVEEIDVEAEAELEDPGGTEPDDEITEVPSMPIE